MTSTPAQPAYPLMTFTSGGAATVERAGDNQVCACGNDTYAADWVAADTTGAMDFQSSGSAHGNEHTICPACGRLYRNADLFTGLARPIARYDITSVAFIEALAQYNRDAYGDEK